MMQLANAHVANTNAAVGQQFALPLLALWQLAQDMELVDLALFN